MVKRREFFRDGLLLAAASAYSPDMLAQYSSDRSPEQIKVSLKRDLVVRYEADVVVIGGGISGVSAACSAALSGARVILVERFGMLGGSLTTGGVANFCGQIDMQGEVFDEILKELRRFNSLGEENKPSVFNYEILAFILQEMVLKRGVKILYHTRLVDVMVKGSNITECIICGHSAHRGRRGGRRCGPGARPGRGEGRSCHAGWSTARLTPRAPSAGVPFAWPRGTRRSSGRCSSTARRRHAAHAACPFRRRNEGPSPSGRDVRVPTGAAA